MERQTERPVGVIENLGFNGEVRERFFYTDAKLFEKEVLKDNYDGEPMCIIQVRDENGELPVPDLAEKLDPPPQGYERINLAEYISRFAQEVEIAENVRNMPDAPMDDIGDNLPQTENVQETEGGQCEYAVYRLKENDELRELHGCSYDALKAMKHTLKLSDYDMAYTNRMPVTSSDKSDRLHSFWKYNMWESNHYVGLDSNDILRLGPVNSDDVVYYYVDGIYYKDVTDQIMGREKMNFDCPVIDDPDTGTKSEKSTSIVEFMRAVYTKVKNHKQSKTHTRDEGMER